MPPGAADAAGSVGYGELCRGSQTVHINEARDFAEVMVREYDPFAEDVQPARSITPVEFLLRAR